MLKNCKKSLFNSELIGIIIILAIIISLLSVFGEGFLSSYNLNNLLKTIAVTIIVGLSQLAVLSIGHLNLALGAMGCLTGMFTGYLLQTYQLPVFFLMIAGLASGAFAGFIQGFFIVKTRINAFIVTLAFVSIFMGIVTGVTKGEVFSTQPDSFKLIGSATIFLGIPLLLILSFIVAVVLALLFFKTVIGRQLLATGSNSTAADFAGINTTFIVVSAHTLSGLLAGVAGILQIAKMGSATPTIGTDWLLVSFAAPILGGTLLSGGKVSILGTILGAALMSIIVNGLFLLDVSQYWFQTFIGGILLTSYGIDKLRRVYLLQKQV